MACVVALHVIRPRVSPIERRLSEYALGPYGWLMDTALTATAGGLAALAIFLTRSAGRPRLVPAALVVSAVALVLSAIYRLDATDNGDDVIPPMGVGNSGGGSCRRRARVVGGGRRPATPMATRARSAACHRGARAGRAQPDAPRDLPHGDQPAAGVGRVDCLVGGRNGDRAGVPPTRPALLRPGSELAKGNLHDGRRRGSTVCAMTR